MKRERTVDCREVTSSGELVIFPDKECNETQKPATSEACERTDCPQWHESEWAPCDATCGNGNRFREVTCIQGNNTEERLSDELCECNSPFKPPRVKSCPDLPTCPTSAPCRKSIQLLNYIYILSEHKYVCMYACSTIRTSGHLSQTYLCLEV
jgi:hypothetical protein